MNDISPTWLPKHDQKKVNTKIGVFDMRKWKREDHKIPTLDKELQAMKEKLRAGETVLPREGH